MKRNVYIIKHLGHYPVGACSVVVATTQTQAIDLLLQELKMDGLNLSGADLDALDIEVLDTTKSHARLVLNGEY